MERTEILINVENAFRKQVQKDKRVRNAYLLVHSEKLGVDMNLAEGKTGDLPASAERPVIFHPDT